MYTQKQSNELSDKFANKIKIVLYYKLYVNTIILSRKKLVCFVLNQRTGFWKTHGLYMHVQNCRSTSLVIRKRLMQLIKCFFFREKLVQNEKRKKNWVGFMYVIYMAAFFVFRKFFEICPLSFFSKNRGRKKQKITTITILL